MEKVFNQRSKKYIGLNALKMDYIESILSEVSLLAHDTCALEMDYIESILSEISLLAHDRLAPVSQLLDQSQWPPQKTHLSSESHLFRLRWSWSSISRIWKMRSFWILLECVCLLAPVILLGKLYIVHYQQDINVAANNFDDIIEFHHIFDNIETGDPEEI